MKKLFAFLSLILIATLPIHADFWDDGSFASEEIIPKNMEEGRPFRIKAEGDYVGKAKLTKKCTKGQDLFFRTSDIEAGMVFYYDACHKEGLGIELSYDSTFIKWDENPCFKQHTFNTAGLSLGFFTSRLKDWQWKAQIAWNLDTNHPNPDLYSTYDFIFWGRYDYTKTIGINVGLLGLTGMNINHIYPVIGFDWNPGEHWKLNVVFPVNMSLMYQFDECWSAGLAARVFTTRNRTGPHENLSRAIVTYQAMGAEFAINYDCEHWFIGNIHAGYNAGGVLKIANRHYSHKRRLDFDGAPYAGGAIGVKF